MSDRKRNRTSNNEHIIFLGETRFPYGFAAVQRMTLMSKALLSAGIKVTIICRKGSWKKSEYLDFNYQGNFEGIDYIYTSKIIYKPEGFLKRNIQKLRGVYGEYKYLKESKKNDGIEVAIISNRAVFHVFRYYLFSVFFDFPIVINLVEMASSMQHRNAIIEKLNDYLLDKWVMRLFDGALPISDKLMDYYGSISPSKPVLKLPILCDFDKFDKPRSTEEEPYFLYCGSMGYKQVIDFIIKAYQTLVDDHDTKLYMIVSDCNKKEIELLEEEINIIFKNKAVKLFSNIPYEQLVYLYINAVALLIPLRPTIQDSSRFPHKIGEYLASGNPVITTNVGEIKNYFEDGKTALIADNFEIDLFAEKMRFVLENPEKAKKIGQNGKKLGFKEFHYKNHGNRIKNFMQELY